MSKAKSSNTISFIILSLIIFSAGGSDAYASGLICYKSTGPAVREKDARKTLPRMKKLHASSSPALSSEFFGYVPISTKGVYSQKHSCCVWWPVAKVTLKSDYVVKKGCHGAVRGRASIEKLIKDYGSDKLDKNWSNRIIR